MVVAISFFVRNKATSRGTGSIEDYSNCWNYESLNLWCMVQDQGILRENPSVHAA